MILDVKLVHECGYCKCVGHTNLYEFNNGKRQCVINTTHETIQTSVNGQWDLLVCPKCRKYDNQKIIGSYVQLKGNPYDAKVYPM